MLAGSTRGLSVRVVACVALRFPCRECRTQTGNITSQRTNRALPRAASGPAGPSRHRRPNPRRPPPDRQEGSRRNRDRRFASAGELNGARPTASRERGARSAVSYGVVLITTESRATGSRAWRAVAVGIGCRCGGDPRVLRAGTAERDTDNRLRRSRRACRRSVQTAYIAKQRRIDEPPRTSPGTRIIHDPHAGALFHPARRSRARRSIGEVMTFALAASPSSVAGMIASPPSNRSAPWAPEWAGPEPPPTATRE